MIRRTAYWSIYLMGPMVAAVGALGLFGAVFGASAMLSTYGGLLWFALLICGGGLIFLPVLRLGIGIWRLGQALLRRKPEAEDEARFLHQAAVLINIMLLAVATVVALNIDQGFRPIAGALMVGYGAIAFAHAEAIRRCAALLRAERTALDLHA